MPDVIHAAPTARHALIGGEMRWVHDLQTALNKAGPGDRVRLMPGVYTRPVTISASGEAGRPITISGPEAGEAILDGGRLPSDARNHGKDPTDADFAFIKVTRERHLVFRRLRFRHCWPTAIYLRGVEDILIEDCDATEGRYVCFARSAPGIATRGVTLRRVSWVQDPLHRMWTGEVTWPQVKLQDRGYDASYFNGALFASFNILGGVRIADCDVSHAFNVVRMDIDPERVREGPDGPEIPLNRDVRIHGCRFAYIRDNAIEPEAGAHDWRVFDNRMFAVHAAFSLDGVAARGLCFVGNQVVNLRSPGAEGDANQGGKIIKWLGLKDRDGPRPRKGVFFAHNSALTRTTYAKKGVTAEWIDRNNAVATLSDGYFGTPDAPRAVITDMKWNDRMSIRGMAATDPTFPEALQIVEDPLAKKPGQIPNPGEVSGVSLSPLFEPLNIGGPHDPAGTPARPGADPSLPLGGWDGALTLTEEARRLPTAPAEIELPDGEVHRFPDGLAPGAHTPEALGIAHWADADPPSA